jgi:hypothetical protein
MDTVSLMYALLYTINTVHFSPEHVRSGFLWSASSSHPDYMHATIPQKIINQLWLVSFT